MSKIVQFEPFKHAKEWDDDFPKFLGNVEKCYWKEQKDKDDDLFNDAILAGMMEAW